MLCVWAELNAELQKRRRASGERVAGSALIAYSLSDDCIWNCVCTMRRHNQKADKKWTFLPVHNVITDILSPFNSFPRIVVKRNRQMSKHPCEREIAESMELAPDALCKSASNVMGYG